MTSAQTPVISDDPDMPGFTVGRISKEQFLKERQDNIDMLRGMPWTLPYNPRIKAIQEKEQQEYQSSLNPNNLVQAPIWNELGPDPIPNGQTTTNLVAVSGRTTAIAIHPTNPNLVYVGTANGGIYRTTNGGNTWTQIFDASQSLAIGALALAPSDPTILYVGTGEANGSADCYAGIGVYRIENADVSPTLVGPINPPVTTAYAGTTAFTGRSISKIIVHPTNPAMIWVTTGNGVIGNPNGVPAGNTIPPLAIKGMYRSGNATAAAGAVSFTKLTVTSAAVANFGIDLTGSRTIVDMVMEPGNPDNIICYVNGTTAAGDGGIFRTTNATDVTPVFTQQYVLTTSSVRGELAINKVGAVVTVIAATGENSSGRILRSIDGGVTWALAVNIGFCSTQCFYDIAIEMDPNNADLLYLGGASGTNIFKRCVNGTAVSPTFTSSTTNLHADVHCIVAAPSSPLTLYMGSDGGIFKTTDGGVTWASKNGNGFKATQFQSIALHPVNTNFQIGGTQDNGTIMIQADNTFTRTDGGDGGYTAIDQYSVAIATTTMYHTYFNSSGSQIGFTRTLNGGATWSSFYGCGGIANGMTCADATLFYAPMVTGPGTLSNTLYFGSDRLYRSANQGTTMTLVSQGPVFAGAPLSSIAISPQDDNVRMIGLTNGNVWATTTGSSVLTNITPPSAPSAAVGRIMIDPLNSNTAFVSYGGYGVPSGKHIFKTTNLNAGSPTWSSASFGIPDVPVNCLAIDPTTTTTMFAGTDIGVYISIDGGTSWSSYSKGLPLVPVFDMAIHPISHLVRIATHGRGFWTTLLNPLPVTFTSFMATPRKNGKVYLEWYTSQEINNKGFELQRALSYGITPDWKKVTFVNGNGTTSSPKKYNYEDQPIGGKKYLYRIKQIDLAGKYKYSEIREVELRDFDYGVYQNYPNPANGSTVIKYQLPEDGKVSIMVYNNLGEKVRELVNENKSAGIYQVEFNVKDLSPGVYYYKFVAGAFYNSKQLIVQ